MQAEIHTIRHAGFSSANLPPRPVDVWLPPRAAGEACAVLYMHDGQNLFDSAQSYSGVTWGVAEAITALMAAGKIPPTLVVGIHNTPNRVGEYLPYGAIHIHAAAEQRFNAWVAAEAGGQPPPDWLLNSDAYLKFIVSELKPFIDSTYRTRPQAEFTAIMGSSMGGLISAYAFCEYPEVFGRAGCLSTHWPIGDGILLDYLAQRLPLPAGRRIYFDYGSEGVDAEYAPYQKKADALLVAAGYQPGRDCLSRNFPGDPHHESAWRARLPIPLEFLLSQS